MNAMQKSQYFSYLRADGRIASMEQSFFTLDHLQVREHGHVGLPGAGELLGELRQRHETEHPHLHHLQLLAPRGM